MNKINNQHGDVIMVSVDSIPKGANNIDVENGWVLERGEGVHTHLIDDVSGVQIYEKDGEVYVKVDKQTTLSHEEHGVQTLEPGIYKKRIERTWDYEAQEARNVKD